MKQRAYMVLIALVTLLATVSTFIVALSPQVGAVSLSDMKNQQSSPSHPHAMLKHSSTTTQQFLGNNLNYNGGPVMTGTTNAYLIFWEPGGNVSTNYNSLIKRYFGDIGGSPLYKIANQYTQTGGGFPSNAVLASSWVDTQSYTETPLLDTDIQHEVTRAQQTNGWHSSINNIFFVFTGRNENLCFDSTQSQCATNTFCAYHSFFSSNTIYAAMPYAASFSCNPGSSPNNDDADQTINVTSHEQMEAATDPLINAWIDANNQEIGDKCAWMFGPLNAQGADVVWNNDPYIVQEEWDNNTSSCRLTPSTTPPTPTPTPTHTPTPTPTHTPTPTPTPTHTPTPTPTHTPTPPPSHNLVVDPGFESGVSPWLESTANGAQLVDPTNPHSGRYSAYLCGYDNCQDRIWQNITLPTSFTSVTFSYWIYISTQELTKTVCYDSFSARLRTSAGSIIATVQTRCNLNASGWTKYTFTVTSQLNAYKGKTIQVYFVGTTDFSLPTNFFVDDVSLVAS